MMRYDAHVDALDVARCVVPRRQFLGSVAAGAAMVAAMGALPCAAAACDESLHDVITRALTAEDVAITLYYAGLTTPAIAGPLALTPVRSRRNRRPIAAYLRAALEQEQAHARVWRELGAPSSHTMFYFPTSVFRRLGYTNHAGTFLWMLDHVETAAIGAYLAAVARFDALGRRDLAELAIRIVGIECEHRALYRVLSADDPADNVTLEVAQFTCADGVAPLLAPFLTGHGFARGAALRATRIPTSGQVTRAIAQTA